MTKNKFKQLDEVRLKFDLSKIYVIDAIIYNQDIKMWTYRIRVGTGDVWVTQDMLVSYE